MEVSDFNDPLAPAVIECEFGALSGRGAHASPSISNWRKKIILRKELVVSKDELRNRTSVKAEYHGYQAEPTAEYLSISKLAAAAGGRVKWKEIAEAYGIVDYVKAADDKVVTKASYAVGISRYLAEHAVEYDEPVLGQTQALGVPQNLLSALPDFFLLPAIADFSPRES